METQKLQAIKPIIQLKEILTDKYGDLIYQIICYGSRITKNNVNSDYDILIITNSKISWRLEYDLSKTIINFGIQNDIVFDPQFFYKHDYEVNYKYLPYIKSIHSTGIVI